MIDKTLIVLYALIILRCVFILVRDLRESGKMKTQNAIIAISLSAIFSYLIYLKVGAVFNG